MEYTTINYETWMGDDNLLKQLKITKQYNDDGVLINTLEIEQSQEEIKAYFDLIKLEQNN